MNTRSKETKTFVASPSGDTNPSTAPFPSDEKMVYAEVVEEAVLSPSTTPSTSNNNTPVNSPSNDRTPKRRNSTISTVTLESLSGENSAANKNENKNKTTTIPGIDTATLCDPDYIDYIVNALQTKKTEFTLKVRTAEVFYQDYQKLQTDVNFLFGRMSFLLPGTNEAQLLYRSLQGLWLSTCNSIGRCIAIAHDEAGRLAKEVEQLEQLLTLMFLTVQQMRVDAAIGALASSKKAAAVSNEDEAPFTPMAKKQKMSDVESSEEEDVQDSPVSVSV